MRCPRPSHKINLRNNKKTGIVITSPYRLRSPKYAELGHFTFLFCRGRQRIVQRFSTRVHSYTHQMFSVDTEPEEFKNTAITRDFGSVFVKSRAGKLPDSREVIFFKIFSVQAKMKSRRFQILQV